MLVIRLSRVGKKNQAIYRIVVAEKEKSAKGKFIEELGTYNPRIDDSNIKINQEKIKYWLEKGAKPSLTVSGILKKEELLPEKLLKEYDRYIENMKKHKKRAKKKEATEEKSAEKSSEKGQEEPKPGEKKELEAEPEKVPAEEKKSADAGGKE